MKLRRKFAVAGAGAVLAGAVFFASVDPKLELAEEYPGGTVLRDNAGRVMRVTLGPGDMDSRPYYKASSDDWIVKALVASEDGRFFSHWGVDPLSVARAAAQNFSSMRRVSGASTLTMQASRLFAPHPKSYFWKCIEAVRALKIEMKRDKLWVLSQYLNRAPFGSNLVGIEAAANGWFGKGPKELEISEAALLAGMVQRPTRFRPDRNRELAVKRRGYVLGRMLEKGYITAEQHREALAAEPRLKRAPRPFGEPFFCDWAVARIKERERKYGDWRTTLDAGMQENARHTVAAASAHGYSAAVVVMRVEDGAVEAMCCSGDYFSRRAGQVNTATAPRPAGSTLKTFLTALALDRGQVTPEERLNDVPRAYRGYRPANFDAAYRGRVKASDALILSLNLPFVEMLHRMGVDEFGNALRMLGFRHMTMENREYGLGMAIGNVHVTLMELVGAYGCVARGGEVLEPCALAEEAERRKNASRTRILSEEACWLVSDILSGDERSAAALGHVADVKTSRFAWKTGTSAGHRDAWTVLWNPEYVVGVWCGYKEGHFGDSRIVGAHAAAPYAWQMARLLYPQQNGPWYRKPENVIERAICADSGCPATPECPRRETGRAIRGRSSPDLCQMHRVNWLGEAETRTDPFAGAFAKETGKARRLEISRPEDGTEFRLMEGLSQQRITFKPAGNPEGAKLWWFVDGAPAGETKGAEKFAWEPCPGEHHVTCASEEGVCAGVGIKVLE